MMTTVEKLRDQLATMHGNMPVMFVNGEYITGKRFHEGAAKRGITLSKEQVCKAMQMVDEMLPSIQPAIIQMAVAKVLPPAPPVPTLKEQQLEAALPKLSKALKKELAKALDKIPATTIPKKAKAQVKA